jgi:hypothetical protein
MSASMRQGSTDRYLGLALTGVCEPLPGGGIYPPCNALGLPNYQFNLPLHLLGVGGFGAAPYTIDLYGAQTEVLSAYN